MNTEQCPACSKVGETVPEYAYDSYPFEIMKCMNLHCRVFLYVGVFKTKEASEPK